MVVRIWLFLAVHMYPNYPGSIQFSTEFTIDVRKISSLGGNSAYAGNATNGGTLKLRGVTKQISENATFTVGLVSSTNCKLFSHVLIPTYMF
jgi:hypothetical protein